MRLLPRPAKPVTDASLGYPDHAVVSMDQGRTEEGTRNLRVDFVEPLFSAVSFILINSNLSLQLRDSVSGSNASERPSRIGLTQNRDLGSA